MSFHLPYWGLGSVHRIVGGICSLSPSEAAAIGAARCGWEGQATSQVCLSEASPVSALLVEEPLITKVGLCSLIIKTRLPGNCDVHNTSRQSDPCVRGDPFPHTTFPFEEEDVGLSILYAKRTKRQSCLWTVFPQSVLPFGSRQTPNLSALDNSPAYHQRDLVNAQVYDNSFIKVGVFV